MLGILLAGLAAASWGAAAIFARLGLQYMRPTTGTLFSLFAGFLLLSAIALPLHWDDILLLPAIAFLWLFLLGLLNFPLGRLLNYSAVRLAGVARATPVLSIAPLFAIALAVLFTGEELTPLLFAGTLAIVAGIALIVSER